MLVLGLGDIGGEFARRCQALGAYVIGVRRQDTHKPDYVDELHLIADLDTLLPRADVVAIAMPGTEETKGMFNDERLARMKEGSIILNVGRGSIIDTAALTRALQSGHLLGAGLDVTDPEPLPDDCPPWDIPSALITPHVSGFFHLRETLTRILQLCVENLTRWENGQPLLNRMDPQTGYRSTENRNVRP